MFSKVKTCLHALSKFWGKALTTIGRRLAFQVVVSVILLLCSATVHARETWRFLPCFGKDVRGIERHAAADGHFHSEVPEQARPLLSEDGGLDESFLLFQILFNKIVRIQ